MRMRVRLGNEDAGMNEGTRGNEDAGGNKGEGIKVRVRVRVRVRGRGIKG